MVFQVTTLCDGILLNTLWASLMLPHFAYMSTKQVSTKTSESHQLWMICWHMHSASPQNGTSFCCICQNTLSTFCQCPYLTCTHTMPFQVITSWDGILLSTPSIHAPTCGKIVNKATTHKDINLNHFELPVHEPACPLQVLNNLHMHWAPEQKRIGQESCLFVAFLGKAQLSSHVVQP